MCVCACCFEVDRSLHIRVDVQNTDCYDVSVLSLHFREICGNVATQLCDSGQETLFGNAVRILDKTPLPYCNMPDTPTYTHRKPNGNTK